MFIDRLYDWLIGWLTDWLTVGSWLRVGFLYTSSILVAILLEKEKAVHSTVLGLQLG